ncbi:MAG: hypothetical protein IJ555_02675 [Ruminococcus sp.]|nr:hypothetical protein [Ruminococcus sp.]
MIVLEKCVFCKHHTFTDKSGLGHFKSFCKAFPDGEGIPYEVMMQEDDAECGNGYKFEPRDEWKEIFNTEHN